MITYLDYYTWYKIYEEIDYTECRECEEYDPIINKYIENYNHKPKDKKIFDDIMNNLDANKKSSVLYYIITDKNYYVFDSSNQKIYRYDESNKILVDFYSLNTCDIDYFHEKQFIMI